MYFRNYGLEKTLLNNGLKIPVSDDIWASNVVSGTKHC